MISWSATAYENTWIHQRRKRRKMEREVDRDEEPRNKKLKTDDACTESCHDATTEQNGIVAEAGTQMSSAERLENDRSYILCFDLNLTNENSSKSLKFIWKDGTSKELLHQVFQYFKNYFEKNKHLSI